MLSPKETDPFNLPYFGVPRRVIVLSTDKDRWTKKKSLEKERIDLIHNPLDLTYMSLLPRSILNLYYPDIFDGRYISEEKPLKQIKSLLQRYNAPDDEEFYHRLEEIQKGFCKKVGLPRFVDITTNSLNLMKELYGNQTRKTKEAKVNHEGRVKLATLTDAYMIHENKERPMNIPGKLVFDPLKSPFHRHTMIILAGADLHDLVEDFTVDPEIALQHENQFVNIYLNTGLTLQIDMEHNFFSKHLYQFLKAISDKKYASYTLTEQEAAEINMHKIIKTLVHTDHLAYIWGLLAVDMADREDNIRTRWIYSKEKNLEKYLETYHNYQTPSFILWNFHHFNAPYPSATVFLKLIGATDNELYNWIFENKELMKDFQRFELENKGPLIIPYIQHAAILTSDGDCFFYQRPEVSKIFPKFPTQDF